jgi:hypothetical protein
LSILAEIAAVRSGRTAGPEGRHAAHHALTLPAARHGAAVRR